MFTRFDEQFNHVDYQFVNIDSRGLVQHPVDGNLYIKHYFGGIYKLNTDPFDGSVELIHNIMVAKKCLLFLQMVNIFLYDYGQ